MLILQAVLVASVIMDFFPPIHLVEYEKCNYFCVILPFDFMLLLLLFLFFFPCVEKHIIVGAEEGIYSLNFSEQLHEAEMEQVITLLGGG